MRPVISVPKFLLLGITFMAAIGGGMYLAISPVLSVANQVNTIVNLPTQYAAGLALLIFMLLAMTVGVYLGVVIWLCFWRFFATRSQILQIVRAGRTCRFDMWLVNSLVPPEADKSKDVVNPESPPKQ